MKRDPWIGIVGCIVHVAAMVGVFTYERANAAAADTSASNVTFRVTWTATNGRDALSTIAPPTGGGITEGAEDTQESGEITLTVPVPPGATPAGGWEVKVEFVTATPAPLPGGIPLPTPPPGSTDSSVAFDIAMSVG